MNHVRTQKRRWKIKFILIAVILCVFFLYSEAGIRSVIRSVAEKESKSIATQIIGEAVWEVTSKLNLQYDDLVKVGRGEQQIVTSIEVDSLKVNQIRSSIVSAITEKLKQMDVQSYEIPLGNLIGNDFLSGRGPNIKLKLLPKGNMSSKIISEFDSAGINQTRHRIVLQLSVEMMISIPFYRLNTQVSSEFIIGETIIVGEVPEYYTQVVSEDETALEKANNYQKSLPDLEK